MGRGIAGVVPPKGTGIISNLRKNGHLICAESAGGTAGEGGREGVRKQHERYVNAVNRD
jgi:hypothetical protein